jgi:hypothetical protein
MSFKRNSNLFLRTAIRDSVGPVLLDSEIANRWRQSDAVRNASIQDEPQTRIEHPLEGVRRIFLCTCPSSFYQAFSHLVRAGFSWSPSPILEMWENMDEELKQTTLAQRARICELDPQSAARTGGASGR